MDLNVTLLGEILTFVVFIWFTMKYVWPPLMGVMEERRKKIAEGLESAAEGVRALEKAEEEIAEKWQQVRAESAQVIDKAHVRANQMVEQAKSRAERESDKLLAMAKEEVERQYIAAKEELVAELSDLVSEASERLLNEKFEKESVDVLLNSLVQEQRR